MAAHVPDEPQGVLNHEDGTYRRDWTVQRIARCIFLLIVLIAMTGVFGGGPLAHTSVTGDGLQLNYDRFVRCRCPLALNLVPDGERVDIRIDGLIDVEDALHATPAPISTELRSGSRLMSFASTPGTPMRIEFEWRPRYAGVHRGGVEVAGTRLNVWTLVYP